MVGVKMKASVLVLGLFLSCCGLSALADDQHHDDGQHGPVRHSDHYYRNGHWYRHGWFGMEVAVPTLSTGVYIETLPPAYTPVVVNGTTYYYGDNAYFVASSQGGYMVVAAPR